MWRTRSRPKLDDLRESWQAAWPESLACWSRFTKLSGPRWCFTADEERREHLTDSFAMIRLADQAVVISLREVIEAGVQAFPREVLAHEIGHHVYVPGNLLDHGRMLARVRRGLPDREMFAPLIANLYADLLINDRLQRQAGLDVAGVYKAIRVPKQRPLWKLYLRTYEILWSLPRNTLAEPPVEPAMEADAGLAARLVRSFARDWLDGAGRFAVLCLTYLLQDKEFDPRTWCRCLGRWCDTVVAGKGAAEFPSGLIEIDADEARGIVHPMYDAELSGVDLDEQAADVIGRASSKSQTGGATGQCREPFEFGQILRALGLDLSDHDLAVRYYRERATPHLIAFPVRKVPQANDPLPEGLGTWDFGEPLEQVDWLETAFVSPVFVPGLTTRQRVWGTTEGSDPERRPIDLDLYVDCSGSMPNPQRVLSPVALAGAIVALSALRVGAAVQATLWSGAGQFETTGGFVRDPMRVLRILTGYLGGGTAFPIHLLRETYARRKPTDRAVHLLVAVRPNIMRSTSGSPYAGLAPQSAAAPHHSATGNATTQGVQQAASSADVPADAIFPMPGQEQGGAGGADPAAAQEDPAMGGAPPAPPAGAPAGPPPSGLPNPQGNMLYSNQEGGPVTSQVPKMAGETAQDAAQTAPAPAHKGAASARRYPLRGLLGTDLGLAKQGDELALMDLRRKARTGAVRRMQQRREIPKEKVPSNAPGPLLGRQGDKAAAVAFLPR